MSIPIHMLSCCSLLCIYFKKILLFRENTLYMKVIIHNIMQREWRTAYKCTGCMKYICGYALMAHPVVFNPITSHFFLHDAVFISFSAWIINHYKFQKFLLCTWLYVLRRFFMFCIEFLMFCIASFNFHESFCHPSGFYISYSGVRAGTRFLVCDCRCWWLKINGKFSLKVVISD